MNIPHKHILFTAGFALLLSLLLAAGPAASAPTGQVDATIQYLIDHVAGSELTFVRNASDRHFRDDIESPEDFIELCATRSLMSGKPYLVIDRQGNTQGTGDWLRAELAAYQVHGP